MTVGEKIKQRRKELEMSVDELANILGKNRATIYRYENDDIENLSIAVLEPLAKALNTSPAYLMGWSYDENISLKNDLIVKEPEGEYNPTPNECHELLKHFDKLNNIGKDEAIKRIMELTFIPLYCNGGE